jgi:glycosyltransferase involved in cell wall biosynthesis
MDEAAAGPAISAQRGDVLHFPSRPRVSVVVPTYNRAASLDRLLRSLDRAVVPMGGLEIVVVVDGSTDDTLSVLAGTQARWVSQPNSGRAVARERGRREARGDIIVFFDDDVVPEPDAIIRMVDALDGADGVGARILPLDVKPVIAHYMHVDGIVNHYERAGSALWLITAAAAFRREALDSIGGFDVAYEQAGEDVDLTLRLVEAGGVIRVEPSAVVYHDHRSRFRGLWSTCYRYGRAYRALASRHAVHRSERRRSAIGRANPIEWWRVYRSYRKHASVLRSLAFLSLHALVAGPYAIGLLRGNRPPARIASTANVELLGRRNPFTWATLDGAEGPLVELAASGLTSSRSVLAMSDADC